MNSSKLIVVNTLATYGRSVLSMGLALFSSRWVLNSLGQSDFGLYSLVGSIIIFIVFINGIMAGSAARFFAYSMGKNNSDDVNAWFNAALSIHACLALGLVGIGWPIGEYIVKHVLSIPLERIAACVIVFRISLLSAFVSILAVPFVAMFMAKQRIAELAVWGILQSILSFLLALALLHATGDRLKFYAFGMVSIVVIVQIIQVIRGWLGFRECKISWSLWFNRTRLKEIFSFASWSLIGGGGSVLRDQGSAILLNLFFGPRVNASYGIASQVSAQTNQLSASMLGAFSPEISASEGRGDRKRMLSLSNQASKFGALLVLFFAIPLMVEIDYVLKLWLHTPPDHAALFCRYILASFLIERLTTGFMLAVSAHGRIAAYQATVGICYVLTLPLAWIFLITGLGPTSLGLAFLITMTGASIGRALWVRHLFQTSIRLWLTDVVGRSVLVGLLMTITALVIHNAMNESILRLLVLTAATTLVAISCIWLVALQDLEKDYFIQNIKKLKKKISDRMAAL